MSETVNVDSANIARLLIRAVDYYSKHEERSPARDLFFRFDDETIDAEPPYEFTLKDTEERETAIAAVEAFIENRELTEEEETELHQIFS